MCGELSKEYLCENCRKVLEEKQKITIKKVEENYYQEQVYVFEYKEVIRDLIIKYKFNDYSYIYKTFSTFFVKNKKLFQFFKTYDEIIPIPISKKRMQERGYNQSELIAKEIAKDVGIKFNSTQIIKIYDNNRQSDLNKEQRKQNVKGKYKINRNTTNENKSILLFDDIITTGSTLKECAKLLSNTNPKKIGVFTIAKD